MDFRPIASAAPRRDIFQMPMTYRVPVPSSAMTTTGGQVHSVSASLALSVAHQAGEVPSASRATAPYLNARLKAFTHRDSISNAAPPPPKSPAQRPDLIPLRATSG